MEIELKLALPTSDPAGLARSLALIPLLARRKAVQQQLHNIYYDTPQQSLHQQRIALRLRRVGSAATGQWLQTLKIGGNSDSALSQRGEWETAVPHPELDADALADTPWSTLDPQGRLFAALAPCFTTQFTRTTWTVRQRDGSAVEVALDIGQIHVDGKSTDLCELELELLAGDARALFHIATQIAGSVATLPLGISKAARGYALASNTLRTPQRANPPALADDLAVPGAALRVLREAFSHFTANLNGVLHSDDPELVHQARVGWRRFKTSLKLFRKFTGTGAPAELQTLRPMLGALGALRDLEVASLETLPMLANAYTDGDPARQAHWRAMEQALAHAADQQRDTLHQALCEPGVGAALLAVTQWLEVEMAGQAHDAVADPDDSLRDWARRHTTRWHAQLKTALAKAHDADSAHRARILAKRLRYGVEALRPLLPKRRAKHWHLQATRLQTDMGATRDVLQALAIAARFGIDPSLVEFLRGVAVGQKQKRGKN
ncbi:MAG: CHAD domain-containing protein [Pseudomonadota bacterium]